MPFPPSAPLGLLERDREIASLVDAVASAAAGRPGMVFIEGEGGIGKTRLLLEARDRAAEAGVQLRSARGSEREQRLPYAVVAQLFATEWDEPGTTAPKGSDGADATAHDGSFATLAALLRVTEGVADAGPLMLVIDDLHLADEPSLQFLAYLARRLDRLPVTVLATLRPFERTATASLLSELTGDHLARSVRPQPLSAAATSELLTGALGHDADGAFSAACREATGGNPLLLSELAKTLRNEQVAPVEGDIGAVAELGPRAVLRTVLVRLAGLSDGAGALARAIAVLGDAADATVSADLAELTPDGARDAAGALIRAEILADDPVARFVHPLVGSAVYEAIPAPDRAHAHAAAAQLLHRGGRMAAVTAAHLVLAPPAAQRWVVDVLVEAAHASRRAGAPADAVTYLQRALAEPPADDRRADIVLALARATMLVDGPAAEAHLREALALSDDAAVRATLALELGRLLMFIGRVDEGLPIVRDAAADLPADAGDLRRMLATAALMAPLYDPSFVAPPELVALGRQLPLEPGLGAKMLAAQSSRQWAYDGGPAGHCADLALAALHGGDLIRADSVFLSVTAVLVLELADRPEADAGWEALLRECALHGSHSTRLAVNLFRSYGLARRGAFDEAEAALDEALDAVRDWNGLQGGIHGAAFRSLVLRERGDLPGARAALEAVGTPSDASDEARLWRDSEIALLNAEGRFDEALDAADAAARDFGFLAHPVDTPPQLHRAIALHGLDDLDAARESAVAALDQARTWGAPGILARALRVLGEIEGGAAGLDHLREAVEISRGTRARLQFAKAQVAFGAGLCQAGQAAEARPLLRAGHDLAAELGAAGLQARARRELHAAGGRLRAPALSGPQALTASERRVAERAAAGDTNRAIADVLFVTPKTVELHLSNTYRKLGISGRRELASVLGPAADAEHAGQ